MNILLWIVFGALAGWIASIIMKSPNGALMDIVIGIVGAVLGGWIMNFFGQAGVTGFNIYSFIVAIIGAIILIAIVRAVRRTA
jgi:uncharacterized membrane protein YeaQ/YmgE (transglycosylase-associated protein family)